MLRTFIFLFIASLAGAKDLKIVAWNMQAHLIEHVEAKRVTDFQNLDKALKPDVLVVTEVAGEHEARAIVEGLGWSEYYAVVSDLGTPYNAAFSGLEFLVISKLPIEKVIEYDANVDRKPKVFSNIPSFDLASIEEVKVDNKGFTQIDQLHHTARLTMRVDLEGGISVFPAHLKSNSVRACKPLSDTIRLFEEKVKRPVPSEIQSMYDNGFDAATAEHLANAKKRESAIVAISMRAQEAMIEGRIPVILGDFNTSYEKGKKGNSLKNDCELKNFSCKKAPFPTQACSDGDGYDDTFAILEKGYSDKKRSIRTDKWSILTKNLGRTYTDTSFADAAIDHIAVPKKYSKRFSKGKKFDEEFGSDHFPVYTVYNSK